MKKKILVVLPNVPLPLNCGGNQGMFNGIDAIKEKYDVYCTYILPLKWNEVDTITPQLQAAWGNNVKVIPYIIQRPKASILKRTGRVIYNKLHKHVISYLYPDAEQWTFGNSLLQHFKVDSENFINYIYQIVQQEAIDLVQVDMIWRATAAITLPPNVKKVFVHHELRYVCHELQMQERPFNPYEQTCFTIANILEREYLNLYDAIITVSETDKNKLIEFGVKTPIYSSISVINTPPTQTLHSTNENILTYVGPEFHNPNYVGIMWFLENCWGKLLQHNPNYKFRIIGKWSTSTITRLQTQYKNVDFLGFVEDLSSVLLDTISIVPITIGSGIRMKLLKASTLGVPFVTTSVGCEGLPLVNGEDCIIADTPEDFINGIIALQDEKLRIKLIESAQKKIVETYSLQALEKKQMPYLRTSM